MIYYQHARWLSLLSAGAGHRLIWNSLWSRSSSLTLSIYTIKGKCRLYTCFLAHSETKLQTKTHPYTRHNTAISHREPQSLKITNVRSTTRRRVRKCFGGSPCADAAAAYTIYLFSIAPRSTRLATQLIYKLNYVKKRSHLILLTATPTTSEYIVYQGRVRDKQRRNIITNKYNAP